MRKREKVDREREREKDRSADIVCKRLCRWLFKIYRHVSLCFCCHNNLHNPTHTHTEREEERERGSVSACVVIESRLLFSPCQRHCHTQGLQNYVKCSLCYALHCFTYLLCLFMHSIPACLAHPLSFSLSLCLYKLLLLTVLNYRSFCICMFDKLFARHSQSVSGGQTPHVRLAAQTGFKIHLRILDN